eukprot:scaffold293320_cov27-Tisochrysis_lutea.AAC.1
MAVKALGPQIRAASAAGEPAPSFRTSSSSLGRGSGAPLQYQQQQQQPPRHCTLLEGACQLLVQVLVTPHLGLQNWWVACVGMVRGAQCAWAWLCREFNCVPVAGAGAGHATPGAAGMVGGACMHMWGMRDDVHEERELSCTRRGKVSAAMGACGHSYFKAQPSQNTHTLAPSLCSPYRPSGNLLMAQCC